MARVALRGAQRLAQLGEGDGLLTPPLEVEDDLGLVLGESSLEGFRPRGSFAIYERNENTETGLA